MGSLIDNDRHISKACYDHVIFRLGRNMAAMSSMAASKRNMAPTSVDELRALSRPQLLKLAGSLGVTLHATLTVRRRESARGRTQT